MHHDHELTAYRWH